MSEISPSVEIRSAAIDAILGQALEARPLECCGLLVGSLRRIECAVRARNTRASPTRYQIDAADHIAAIRKARTVGMQVVGAYHSHPASPPVPSATDLAESTYADYVHLIVSPDVVGQQGDRFGIYRIKNERFEQLRMVVI